MKAYKDVVSRGSISEMICPYCSAKSDICMASLSAFFITEQTRANLCEADGYDNCPLFLAKILRRR